VKLQLSSGRPVRSISWARTRGTTRSIALTMVLLSATAGCDVNSALERVSEARRLSADLLVRFTKATDASNRAVMADTDEASVSFAREAEQAKQAVQTNIDALGPILQTLEFSDETRLLQEFVGQFAEYRDLDRRILDIAVENTNVKAQRLSFGPAQEAADAFRDSLQSVVPADAAKDTWRVKALVATAVATVREMQVLQAPHIAEADDAVMTHMEKRMATSEAAARAALETLAPLVQPASRPRLAAATAALDKFVALNAQIMALSRRNTNVRSLALALNQKGKVTGACDQSLHALRDALAKRGFTGTR
jgi:negative regulator of replication initiation